MEDNKDLTSDEIMELSPADREAYLNKKKHEYSNSIIEETKERVRKYQEENNIEPEAEVVETEEIEEEVDIDESTDEEVSSEPEEETETETEAVAEEEVEVDESSEEETEEEVDEVDSSSDEKKFTIRYNKVDIELDEEKIIELAQKGMNYDTKKAKLDEAVKIDEMVKAGNISEQQIEAIARLNSGDENALVDFFAIQELDVEDFSNKLYDINNEDVIERQEYHKEQVNNYNPNAAIVNSRMTTVQRVDTLSAEIPGLAEYSANVFNSKDTVRMNNLLETCDQGYFDTIKKDFNQIYANMDFNQKQRLSTDMNFFEEVFNETVTNVSKPTVSDTKPSVEKSSKMSIEESEKKKQFQKPKNQKPTKVSKEKKDTRTAQQIAEDLVSDPKFRDKINKKKKKLLN